MRESVKQLIADKITKFGLESEFTVLDTEIRSQNGSLIVFKGLQSFNAHNIKSLEGFDICWVEEAQSISAVSWRMLRPTIRKEGSEIWCSWNPRHDSDAIDQFFRGAHCPDNAIVVSVNWDDNPWLKPELLEEKNRDYRADPEMADHVWGGGYELVSEGSYYAKLISAAEKDGRFGHFPYRPELPLHTSWDLGVDDYTAIWFIQNDGRHAFVVDYYEVSGEGPEQIVPGALPELNPDVHEAAARLIELDRPVPFQYAGHFLPHDVKNREWGAGGRERSLILMGYGVKPIFPGVATNPENRIGAVRKLLPLVHFHDSARVKLGLKRLRRYSRKFSNTMQVWQSPLHDENSHGADAFGEYAINCGLVPPIEAAKPKPRLPTGHVILPGPPVPQSSVRIRI